MGLDYVSEKDLQLLYITQSRMEEAGFVKGEEEYDYCCEQIRLLEIFLSR